MHLIFKPAVTDPPFEGNSIVIEAEVRKKVDVKAMKEGFTGNDSWLSFLMDAVFTGDLIANVCKEARGELVIQGKG